MQDLSVVEEPNLIISADKDSTMMCVERALLTSENKNRTLFDECVANLSTDAIFTMVTDMKVVAENPERFRKYLPEFVLAHKDLFLPFVLSLQMTVSEERISHMWVFTYKD